MPKNRPNHSPTTPRTTKKSQFPGTLPLKARSGHFPFYPIYDVRPAAAGLSSIGLQIALHATRSPVTLVEELCDAWEALDAGIVEPLLADDLHYSSRWLLKETNTKEEYLEYLRSRFQSIRNSGESLIVKLGVNRVDGEYAVAIQLGDTVPSLIRIVEKDGKIKEMWMQPAE